MTPSPPNTPASAEFGHAVFASDASAPRQSESPYTVRGQARANCGTRADELRSECLRASVRHEPPRGYRVEERDHVCVEQRSDDADSRPVAHRCDVSNISDGVT